MRDGGEDMTTDGSEDGVETDLAVPARYADLFWDLDPATLDPRIHKDQVIRRFLEAGDWDAISWLRGSVGDETLRDWFLRTRGRGLDPRRLRFWELVLSLPREEVEGWVEEMRKDPWHRRASS